MYQIELLSHAQTKDVRIALLEYAAENAVSALPGYDVSNVVVSVHCVACCDPRRADEDRLPSSWVH